MPRTKEEMLDEVDYSPLSKLTDRQKLLASMHTPDKNGRNPFCVVIISHIRCQIGQDYLS